MFVPKQRTPVTDALIVSTLADRYEGIVGGEMPHGLLGACAAQIVLETGRKPWNYNPGNIRGTSPSGDWTTFEAGEIINGVEVILPEGAHNTFRAYLSWDLGVDDYLRLICLGRFAPAADKAAQEDYQGFVHELHRLCYFTAGENRYAHGVLSVETLLAKLPQMAAYAAATKALPA